MTARPRAGQHRIRQQLGDRGPSRSSCPCSNAPVAVPVLAKLVIKDTCSASRLWLACRMAQILARALPGRRIHLVADAAYAGEQLPPGITWTTRLRKDAALHELPPARTGRRGRPRAKGARLPSPGKLAADAAFAPVTVTRYGKTATIQAAAATCLWYGVFGPGPSAPSRSSSPARPSPPAGTPRPGTTPPTSRLTAPAPPGTRPRPARRPQTCSPSSAASSSREISGISP
jgi:hypothetical protein